jgi:hypothetical protein
LAARAIGKGEDFSREPVADYQLITKENVDEFFPQDQT